MKLKEAVMHLQNMTNCDQCTLPRHAEVHESAERCAERYEEPCRNPQDHHKFQLPEHVKLILDTFEAVTEVPS